MNRIEFRFSKGEETLVLDEPDFGVTEYSGIEATDYELEKSVNSNFIGERLKRKKVLSRPIAISADYLGNEDKSDKRQELIRFFSPFSSGTLTVNHLGVEREIEYEVESFHFTSQNIYDVLEFEIELSCLDPMFKDIVQTGEAISTWVKGWRGNSRSLLNLKREENLKRTSLITDIQKHLLKFIFTGRQSIRRLQISLQRNLSELRGN